MGLCAPVPVLDKKFRIVIENKKDPAKTVRLYVNTDSYQEIQDATRDYAYLMPRKKWFGIL
jgi:hypothetical protein